MSRLPRHIAIIMDGNGRWAKQHGQPRVFGHQNGVNSVKEVVETSARLGIEFLTLYAFSTENWNRPQSEINALMELLISAIHRETETLNKNDIRLHTIGDIKSLPEKCILELNDAKAQTRNNTRLNLIIALSYSSKWEILDAAKKIATKVKNNELKVSEINEEVFSENLCTAGFPDPELLIRTSGEERISNFLLWQIAYSELYFTPVLWPDFNQQNLFDAIINYQGRERRFGKTSDQLINA